MQLVPLVLGLALGGVLGVSLSWRRLTDLVDRAGDLRAELQRRQEHSDRQRSGAVLQELAHLVGAETSEPAIVLVALVSLLHRRQASIVEAEAALRCHQDALAWLRVELKRRVEVASLGTALQKISWDELQAGDTQPLSANLTQIAG